MTQQRTGARQVALGVAADPDGRHTTLVRLPNGEAETIGANKGASVILAVEGSPALGFSVLGFSLDGELAADSWYATLPEAQAFARQAFAIGVDAWLDVPPDVLDVHGYALQRFGLDVPEA